MSKRSKLLREENNESEKKLSKETNDVLTDIVVYIIKSVFTDRPLKLIIAIIAVLCIAAAAYLLIPDSTTAVLMRPHIAAVLIFIALVYIMYRLIDESLD